MEFGLDAHGWLLRGALVSAQNTLRHQILSTKEMYFPGGTSDWEGDLGWGEEKCCLWIGQRQQVSLNKNAFLKRTGEVCVRWELVNPNWTG